MATQGSNYEFRYRGVHRVVIRPDGTTFCVISGLATPGYGVYVTKDGGTTWTQAHSGAHGRDFIATPDGTWYVTSASHTSSSGAHGGIGIASSTDGGANWTNLTAQGMSWFNCWAMAIDPVKGAWLVVAAPGSGLFRADLVSGMRAPRGRGRSR